MPRQVTVITTSTPKNSGGSGANPRISPNGETTTANPASTPPTTVSINARLALLLNGLPVVRMTSITSVCVANDSMNQPAKKSSGPALKIQSITPNVRKSYKELIGPSPNMKRWIMRASHFRGRATQVASTLSVGILNCEMSYRKLLSRICAGNKGKNGSTAAATAMLKIFPKFELG